MLLSPSLSHSNSISQYQREMLLQEECAAELLTLGLGINSSWSPDVSKKRKRPKDDSHTYELFMRDATDDNLVSLLRTRDQMMRQDPKGHGVEDGKGIELIRLLLMAATAIDSNDKSSIVNLLTELYQNVSLAGDPVQRVTAYFADGLAARLLTRCSPFYNKIISYPTAKEEFSAFTQLYQASPYYQFAHFTANQAIIETFEEEEEHNGRSLHVIDFDVSYGFQWPSLIQSLSDKATRGKPITLHVTGLGQSIDKLKETEIRLTNFAKGCDNLFFKFEGLLRGSKSCDFKRKKSETLVVNSVFFLQSLRNSTEITAILKDIYLLNPSLVVLVEKEGSRVHRNFLSRFMESLHYFAAMFDSLDDCLPAESLERFSIENNHLGREIKNILICGQKEEKNSKCDKLESLKERMEKNHFEGVKLSSRSVSQAKLLLKIKSHCSTTEHGSGGGFRVFERDDGRGLSLGWQDQYLVTASAWRCARYNSHVARSQASFAYDTMQIFNH